MRIQFFSRAVFSVTFALLLVLLATISTAQAAKPNVVVFFIDDLGQRDLGCYGSEFYETPNMDKLASRGVRFMNFYSANPVCSPTRAAMMTGKAPQRVGITQWLNQPNELFLPLEEETIGEAFKGAGYRTGYIGKWHLGDRDEHQPDRQGFDWVRSTNRAGAPGSYFQPFSRKKRKQETKAYWDVPDLKHAKPGDYLTDKLTDHALDFINEESDKPFFLCFAHYAVHTPIQAPEPLVKKYRTKKSTFYKEEAVPFFAERNEGKTRSRQDEPTYSAMMENLDTNIGRVLQRLKSQKTLDNTIVILTSDNGGLSTLKRIGPTSCKPFRAGKGWTYEGGTRIPTIISWPAKINPTNVEAPAITMDIYPTLLELVGIPQKPQQHLDGVSLVSALNGAPNDGLQNRFLAWTYPHHHGSQHTPSNAIRAGNWKLVELIEEKDPSKKYELYDLEKDIGESKNLAAEMPEKVTELTGKLQKWLDETTP